MAHLLGLFRRDKPAALAPSPPPNTAALPPLAHPVLTPQALLMPRIAQINRIEELAGLPGQHFKRYYLQALENYAAFVQQTPASESHHHAHAGGLLDHTLEVIIHALTLRQGYLLPPGSAVESMVHTKDAWTYGVFAAALCHDLAKPALDQKIAVLDADGNTLGDWNPFAGNIADFAQSNAYRIEFVRNRAYRLHEQASLLFVHRILPAEGLTWLAGDRPLFSAWCACVSGNASQADVLGEIVGLSDQSSVAKNLGAESHFIPAAKSHVVPLHEKLLTALRQLLEENALPLNRNGAAGFRQGNRLWLVSKRTIDSMRLHLNQTGHTGIPSDNQRIFDILQEQRILEPYQDRAIWRMTVQAEQWSHDFTLICIPLIKLWPDPTAWPDEFTGSVSSSVKATDSAEESEISHDAESANSTSNPMSEHPTKAVQVAEVLEPESRLPQSEQSPPLQHRSEFVNWLVAGLEDRTIPYNQAEAQVHVVTEGVILVTPGLFKAYAKQHPSAPDWEEVQRRFLKLKLHEKTELGFNVFKYEVSGKTRTNPIMGVLIKDIGLFFKRGIPKPNPHLMIKT